MLLFRWLIFLLLLAAGVCFATYLGWTLHKEELKYEVIKPSQRNYK